MEGKECIGKSFKVESDHGTGYLTMVGKCVGFEEKNNKVDLEFSDGQVRTYPLSDLKMTGPGAGDGILFPGELEQGKFITKTQVMVSMPEPVDDVEVLENKKKAKFYYHIKHATMGDITGVGATLNEAEKEFKKDYRKKALA